MPCSVVGKTGVTLMMHAMTVLLLGLVLVFGTGCISLGASVKPEERVVFVHEALTVDGSPRQILKTTTTATADVAYFDGDSWVVVKGVEIPAGWLIVSPKVMNEKVNQ